ncbi:MAG TPA: hypothetical protein VKB79_27090 [Bryobacteraceae bacterium]|nr:hypothetical protein [Bryobacteraceae bacterium]
MSLNSAAPGLLSLWDRAQNTKPGKQALLLVQQCGLSLQDAEELRVGDRDAKLLRLRALLFGGEADATARCPECGDVAALTIRPADLILPEVQDPATDHISGNHVFGDYVFTFRPPTAGDAAALAAARNVEAAELMLLRRCVTDVKRERETIPPQDYQLLPADLVDFISRKMEEADPQAVIGFDLTCPACETRWTEMFDIASFLWTEISREAMRLFREVDELAIRYGWAESAILDMHPARRRMYLEMTRD